MKLQKQQTYLKELRVTSADVECALCSHERHNQGDHDQGPMALAIIQIPTGGLLDSSEGLSDKRKHILKGPRVGVHRVR